MYIRSGPKSSTPMHLIGRGMQGGQTMVTNQTMLKQGDTRANEMQGLGLLAAPGKPSEAERRTVYSDGLSPGPRFF